MVKVTEMHNEMIFQFYPQRPHMHSAYVFRLLYNQLFMFNAWIFSLQTSMSVALTMVAVLTTVPTPRALSRAAAEVDSSWRVMEGGAMVSECVDMSRGGRKEGEGSQGRAVEGWRGE